MGMCRPLPLVRAGGVGRWIVHRRKDGEGTFDSKKASVESREDCRANVGADNPREDD